MRHASRRLATAALATLAGLIAPATPSALADSGPGTGTGTEGPSVLVMTVTADTPAVPVTGRSVVLECGATPGGDHPEPEAGCATLRADGLDFTSKPTLQVMCPDIVQPVTVTATGLWSGAPVDYEHTYANECLMQRATGVLFAF